MTNKNEVKKDRGGTGADDGRIEKLERELKERTRLADERLNQIKYLQADFDNFRKSLEKEKLSFASSANQALVKELLPLIDDLESAAGKAGNREAKEGYGILLKKLLDILSRSGLKQINALGEKFDPYYHEAMMSLKSDNPEGTVLEELQKGYLLNSKVIRHSKVKVAKK